MSVSTLLFLADFHLELGLIGIDEHQERVRVALWLYGDDGTSDPRRLGEGDDDDHSDEAPIATGGTTNVEQDDLNPSIVEFMWSEWCFTMSDPDHYPSVPHGHFQSPNRKWPKMNPYNGRVFTGKHQEDKQRRLKRADLIDLWSNERFRNFCRSHVLFYAEMFPHYTFPVKNKLRFPRPWKRQF